jgi:hypothetical protein
MMFLGNEIYGDQIVCGVCGRVERGGKAPGGAESAGSPSPWKKIVCNSNS